MMEVAKEFMPKDCLNRDRWQSIHAPMSVFNFNAHHSIVAQRGSKVAGAANCHSSITAEWSWSQ